MTRYPLTDDTKAQQPPVLSEQLHLPFHDGERGISPLRLLEPITSLNLTPFATKAARGIGVATVGDLATFVFDPSKECRGLGQGHIEEIRRKIEQFVGKPPYEREYCIEIASLLRLSLCDIDASEKALIVTRCHLQQVIPLSPQESREAEISLIKDKDQKFLKSIEKARLKASEKILALLNTIFCGFVKPWMLQRGGIAHEREILLFVFEAQRAPSHEYTTIGESILSQSSISSALPTPKTSGKGIFDVEHTSLTKYTIFEKSLSLLNLLTGSSFLFSHSLCHVTGKVWALSPQEQVRAREVLQDAHGLIGKGRDGVSLHALAKAVKECRFEQWDACTYASIERLLFWYYFEPLCPFGERA
jgi:hypothetical protein